MVTSQPVYTWTTPIHSNRKVIISFYWQLRGKSVSAVPQCGRWGQRDAGRCVRHGPTRWRYSAAGWWPRRIAARYWPQRHAAASASSCPAHSRQPSGGSRLAPPPEEQHERERMFLLIFVSLKIQHTELSCDRHIIIDTIASSSFSSKNTMYKISLPLADTKIVRITSMASNIHN